MNKIIRLLNKILYKKQTLQPKVNHNIPIKKILVVSNTALGDTILSTPTIKTLRKNFSHLYICFMVNKKVYSLFKDFEYVNEVIVYNKNFWGLLQHIFFIRKNHFDSIFFLHSNGPQDLFLALATNVPYIHKAINYPNQLSSEFKTLINHPTNFHKEQHIIEHRLDVIKNLGITQIDTTLSLPKKFYQIKEKQKDKLIIGFQLGAAEIYKMWPIAHFTTLANQILEDENTIIYLLGIQSENYLALKLEQNIQKPERIKNYCGKTNIEELPKKMQDLDLLITNDTGSLHLAIALKIRTISLFSPTSSQIFGPYQDFNLHLVIQKNTHYDDIEKMRKTSQEGMNLIKIEEVYEAFKIQKSRIEQCAE